MKKSNYTKRFHYIGIMTLTALAALILAGILWMSSGEQTRNSTVVIAPDGKRDEPASTQSPKDSLSEKGGPNRDQHGAWQASPFQIADGKTNSGVLPEMPALAAAAPADKAEPEVVSPEEAARRKKMADLGYLLPPEYYNKDLKTLRKLAKAGDAFAMMHMGEKYYFEMNGQTNHPEYESTMDYANAAKQSFKDALAAGNIRSAGIIAELYFQEKNTTEAYAWHLVSDQLGDSISADWFRRTDMAMQASEAIKQAAALRAAQIIEELKKTKKYS